MRKEHKNPKGGLTAAGRRHFKRKEGANLTAPVKSGTNPRRVSFAARFGGMAGALKDKKGRPTRLKLALKAWGFGSKEAARNFAKRHKKKKTNTAQEDNMPGHYGKKGGMKKPKGKGGLTKKQKTLPPSLKKAIMAKKKKKK